MSAAVAKPTPNLATTVLAYLQHQMPAYPFDPKLDAEFVRELLDDFHEEVDVLDETKGFRWFYCQQPPPQRSMRLSLRRWIANAKTRRNRAHT